jgi:transposase InsO family protein
MQQVIRTLTLADAGVVGAPRMLICDRDRKWNRDVRRLFEEAGIRVVLTPERAPNANAYAEGFVRSIKNECLDRIIPIGERHFRRRDRRVCRALPSGAESSRARQSLDRGPSGN